jgi:exodeoxyribonuclease V alpha subunit
MVREIMVFLHGHGVGTSRAFRIYKAYGEDAIEKVQENPYRLVEDIWGIGFKTADQIAGNLGIGKESDIRARAGVEHVLQELTEEGHCAFPRDGLVERAVKILEIPAAIIENAIDVAIAQQRLVQNESADRGELVYLASLDASERGLAHDLISLHKGVHPCPPIDLPKAIEWVEKQMDFELALGQRNALELAVCSKVMVITGGPGVGKTSVLKAIVKVLRAKHLDAVLCAPTGRAAKRMTETIGMNAKTIHRLLEFDPITAGFKHDRNRPLDGEVFILDEMSMVDLVLAYQLVRAIPQKASLILVGDVDQLPSVGPGAVLHDIIDSGVIPVCKLVEVFRQAAQSAIITNAHRINQGLMPKWPTTKTMRPTETDFYFVEVDEPTKAAEMIVRLTRERIPQKFGFDSRDDIQVLTPMQRGDLGARNLNQILQAALNPEAEEVTRYGWTFRVGDKVMQVVNNYDKDVFNGDIGRVVGIDRDEQQLTLRFDGLEVAYGFDELDELVLSYAATIHKSQGSEYPCVVVPIHTQHYMLLQRNLLYTAVTRGRKLVVLVGTKKAIAMAVKRVNSRRRITTLRERLMESSDARRQGDGMNHAREAKENQGEFRIPASNKKPASGERRQS